MSGPTRQRSLRERLHGIGISWQGKKSKSYHSKDGQSFSEAELKSGSLDSRSCDPIPSCDENIDKVPSSESDTPKDIKKESSDAEKKLPQAAAKVQETTEGSEQKESGHPEKKLLCRTVTQPHGTQEYTVQASDTLAGIAARFDTTPSELAKLNRLSARLIFPGQSLFVLEKKSLLGDGGDDRNDSSKMSSTEQHKDTPGREGDAKSDNLLPGDGWNGNGAPISQRKASVTDALRIPYRRHSDRMQRFLKVKARHFTDGQGVVSGVLIITPNAVMFDPNVSDPLVIEHGTESYGVIAPLDMVMRAAIYYDIAHMKVKNVPETQTNIPKADVYFGKQSSKLTASAEYENNLSSSAVPETKASEDGEKCEECTPSSGTLVIKIPDADDTGIEKVSSAPKENVPQKVEENVPQKVEENVPQKVEGQAKEATNVSSAGVSEEKKTDSTEISTVQDSKQSDFVSHVGKQLQGPNPTTRSLDDTYAPKDENARELSGNNVDSKATGATDSSLPQMDTEKPTESRRERMLKRLSYPMESITSYTQSSISRILSSSPKSLVDFSSGLFVRTSEEEKVKESSQIAESDRERDQEDEQVSDTCPEKAEEDASNQSSTEEGAKSEEKYAETATQEKSNEESASSEQQVNSSVIGYKNLVEEKPEVFAVLDKLLGQHNEQENEGPPLYLCIRMGHPKERKVLISTPILSYGKKRAKSEYWFSIPHNRVEDLYTFIQQWIPNLYGDVDEINPDDLGFVPIDDTEESDVEQEEETKEESGKENESVEEEEKKSNPRSFLKLVEDHFGFRSISPTDWEVLSMNEADKVPSIEFELPLPELLSPSEIFNESHVKELYPLLPARACGYPWTMIFSTSTNGFSLKTMYRRMASYDTPILLTIADIEGAVFGALLSSALKPSDHFYGTGESFLYTFHPEFKVFKWTGDNLYFIKGDVDSVAIGAGDGLFGLWLDADLYRGSSKKCLTFDNPTLSSSEDFTIMALEAWGFV